MSKFVKQVEGFGSKAKILADGITKQSVMNVIHHAQQPTEKSGRMRVDTGFLRNSGKISFTGLPVGASIAPEEYNDPTYEEQPLPEIQLWDSSKPLWFGWTANYARTRELKDGFLATAILQWNTFINRNTAELRRRAR